MHIFVTLAKNFTAAAHSLDIENIGVRKIGVIQGSVMRDEFAIVTLVSHRAEDGGWHAFEYAIVQEDGTPEGDGRIGFKVEVPAEDGGFVPSPIMVPIQLNPGKYSLRAFCDSKPVSDWHFTVELTNVMPE